MNIFQKYLAEEFVEDYQEGRLSRRQALKMIAGVTGSLVLASSLLAACAPVESDGGSPGPASAGVSSAEAGGEPDNSATSGQEVAINRDGQPGRPGCSGRAHPFRWSGCRVDGLPVPTGQGGGISGGAGLP